MPPQDTINRKYLQVCFRKHLVPIRHKKNYYYFFTIKANGKYALKDNATDMVTLIRYVRAIMSQTKKPRTRRDDFDLALFLFETDSADRLHCHGILRSKRYVEFNTLDRRIGYRLDFKRTLHFRFKYGTSEKVDTDKEKYAITNYADPVGCFVKIVKTKKIPNVKGFQIEAFWPPIYYHHDSEEFEFDPETSTWQSLVT